MTPSDHPDAKRQLEGEGGDRRVETLLTALRRIAFLRPGGDIDTAKGTRKLVEQMERIALNAIEQALGQ